MSELWGRRGRSCPSRGRIVPASPCMRSMMPPGPGTSGLRAATIEDLDLLVPACAATHFEELGVDPLRARPGRVPPANGVADPGGALVALGRGRDDPLQGRGLRLDAERRAAPAGLGRSRRARRRATRSAGSSDLCRLLLERTPSVCLFVRPENAPAIRLYERSGCGAQAPTGACSSERTTVGRYRRHGSASFQEGGRGGHPPLRADPARGRGHLLRLGRCGLDLPLARAARAGVRRLGAPRRPRPARRRVGRGRGVLPRRARSGGRRRTRRQRPRRSCGRSVTRSRPTGCGRRGTPRPTRSRPSSTGSSPRARRAASTGSGPTASFAPYSTAGATRPRLTASPRGSTSAGTRRIRTRSAA